MRTATLTLVSFVVFGFATKAQKFSLLPQVGFENSKTTIRYNELSSFAPAGTTFTPQVGLTFSYTSKKGHGAFLGAANSRSIVEYSFTDPEIGMTNYTASSGDMQLRFETGYLFNSKPLYLKKQGSQPGKSAQKQTSEKKSCGSYSYKSYCSKNKTAAKPAEKTGQQKQSIQTANKGSWVKLQPSVGMGFIPGVPTDVITKTQSGQTTYEYRAGNWNTALVTGMGFEFGKDKTRLFTVSVNYFKGIGNLDKETISTVSATKTLTTQLQSNVSGWNMRIGMPFTLGAKKTSIKPQTVNTTQQRKTSCSQYRSFYRSTKIN